MTVYKFPTGERYVIAGLARKRAEIAGQIEATHAGLRKLIADLEHIDAALLIFDPKYPVGAIKPKAVHAPEDWCGRGEMGRYILDTLRTSNEPLTNRDIAVRILSDRGMDCTDIKLIRVMVKRVGASLWRQHEKGRVIKSYGPGQWLLWEIAS